MHVSAIRRIGITSVLVALSLILLSLAASDTQASFGTPEFDPGFDTRLCNVLSPTFGGPTDLQGGGRTCTPDGTPSGHPDIGVVFDIPTGQHNYNQQLFVGTLQGFTLADHSLIPIGTVTAGLRSTVSLGLGPNKCDNTPTPEFIFYKSTIVNTGGSVIAVQAEGTADRFSTLALDGGDAFALKADANSPVVTSYPDVSNRLFDPDGSGDATGGASPVAPIARYAGLTNVAGNWQLLQIFIFAPGVLKTAFSAFAGTTNHPYAKLDASLGEVTITILNDPTSTKSSISPISDFCSPLAVETGLLGVVDTNGDTVPDTNRVNAPASSEHAAIAFTQSFRDADNDGLENSFDTCPWAANVDNPYLTNGTDADMLDPACDVVPAVNENFGDFDLDGYQNAQDLCPKVNNPPSGTGELDSETSVSFNTASPDGGPGADQIGDDCDSEFGGSDTVANGGFFSVYSTDAVCITNGAFTDGDGDGWCGGGGNDPNDANASVPEAPPAACAASPVSECSRLTVNSSVRIPSAVDSDADGYTSSDEVKIGTDPLNKCSKLAGHDSWPPDFDRNRVINITDVGKVLPPVFGSVPGNPAFTARADLAPNNVINITDVGKVLPPVFGSTCTPTYP